MKKYCLLFFGNQNIQMHEKLTLHLVEFQIDLLLTTFTGWCELHAKINQFSKKFCSSLTHAWDWNFFQAINPALMVGCPETMISKMLFLFQSNKLLNQVQLLLKFYQCAHCVLKVFIRKWNLVNQKLIITNLMLCEQNHLGRSL